jgi:hypothetical protein
MASDPDELVVLCNRVEEGPSSIYGSAREECVDCHKQVWLSPATRATAEQSGNPFKILCIYCGEKRMRENPDEEDELMPPSPEQIRELFKGLADMN